MNNETNMEIINEVAETGMEIVTNTAGNNDLLKKIGEGFGYAAAGALAYKGIECLIRFGKNMYQKKKDEKEQAKTSDEKTENVEK